MTLASGLLSGDVQRFFVTGRVKYRGGAPKDVRCVVTRPGNTEEYWLSFWDSVGLPTHIGRFTGASAELKQSTRTWKHRNYSISFDGEKLLEASKLLRPPMQIGLGAMSPRGKHINVQTGLKFAQLPIVEKLTHRLYIVKVPKTGHAKKFKGPFQLVHDSGAKLLAHADVDVLKDYAILLTSFPQITAIFDVMPDRMNAAFIEFHKAIQSIPMEGRQQLRAYAASLDPSIKPLKRRRGFGDLPDTRQLQENAAYAQRLAEHYKARGNKALARVWQNAADRLRASLEAQLQPLGAS